MPLLPALGTASYNGISFDSRSNYSCEGRPVEDAAGRTVTHVIWTLKIHGYVTSTSPTTTDTQMDSIKAALTAYGGELHLDEKGFGQFAFNAGGAVVDLMWGPKPRLLSFKPLGGAIAAEVDWTVEIAAPYCFPGSGTFQFAPMEFNFKVSFAVDRSGYTKRSISGHLRIPQTRATVNSRNLLDNADAYLDQNAGGVIPPIPIGFRRTEKSHDLDESKCVLTFSFVDEEMPPNYPPAGVVECSADHTFTSSQSYGTKWTSTLNASYELVRGVGTPSMAIEAFKALLLSRKEFMRQNAALFGVPMTNAYPSAFTLREPQIYGKTVVALSCSYLYTCDLPTVLSASALWTPVPNNDYSAWFQGSGFSQAPRGNAGLYFTNSDDYLIDLCQPNTPVILNSGQGIVGGQQASFSSGIIADAQDPASSWVDFLLATSLEPVDGTCELKPLPMQDPGNPLILGIDQNALLGAVLTTGGLNQNNQVTGVPIPQIIADQGASGPSVVTTRTAPSWYVSLRGHAVRAGIPIATPVLVAVGSALAIPANQEGVNYFSTGVIGTWGNVPIIGAAWELRWLLDRTPDVQLPIFGNPLAG